MKATNIKYEEYRDRIYDNPFEEGLREEITHSFCNGELSLGNYRILEELMEWQKNYKREEFYRSLIMALADNKGKAAKNCYRERLDDALSRKMISENERDHLLKIAHIKE